MKIFKDIWKFIDLPDHEIWLLMIGLTYSILLKIALLILPVKKWMTVNKHFLTVKKVSKLDLAIIEKNFFRLIHKLPWSCSCLFKAHLLQFLLTRAGIQSNIKIAVLKIQPGLLNAHAYVETETQKTYFRSAEFTDLCTLQI